MIAAALALVVACAGSADESAREERWLAAARDAARWLEACAVETEAGVGWRAVPASDQPLERSLYAGSAGVICFLLELAAASGEEHWLELATRAGAELAASPPARDRDHGLWTGLAGEIFALERLARASGDARFDDAARAGLAALHAAAGAGEGAASFGPCHDVIGGDAGIGFLLLHTARALERPEDLALARRLGAHLVEAAVPSEHGLDWPMVAGEERRMPGFSHGTAGIATFLCELGRASGERTFVDPARAGAEYLLAIAREREGTLRLAHHLPGGEDLHYLGWCHGPAGTRRLFVALARAAPDERWRDAEARVVRTLLASGLPAARPPGYWENVGQCCGAAGIVHALLEPLGAAPAGEAPDASARARHELARALGEDVLARARRDEHGLAWPQAEHRVRPELVLAQTGYMQGAAGVGIALLELAAAERGATLALRLPDDPR